MPSTSAASKDCDNDNDLIANRDTKRQTRVSRARDENGMSYACCRTVGHTQQRFNWDCGLSCVLMALDAAEEFEAKEEISKDIEKVCQSEGFGHSTWTIDLCYLLKNYAPQLAFSYTTVTLGVDPSYMDQVNSTFETIPESLTFVVNYTDMLSNCCFTFCCHPDCNILSELDL